MRVVTIVLSCLALLTGIVEAAETAAVQSAPATGQSSVAGQIAWPIAALIIVLVLRGPLTTFFESMAGRATKLSIWQMAIEMSPAAEASAPIDVTTSLREASALDAGNDSSGSLFASVDFVANGDFVSIDLGDQKHPRWLTSRLLVFAVLLEHMQGVRYMAFSEQRPGEPRYYLGYARTSDVHYLLAMQFPWLERAWADAYCTASQKETLLDKKAGIYKAFGVLSAGGAIPSVYAIDALTKYLANIQSPPLQLPSDLNGWTPLDVRRPNTYHEHAKWLNADRLERIFGPRLITHRVDGSPDIAPDEVFRQLLRRPAPLVAKTSASGQLIALLDRTDVLEKLATRYAFDK